MANLIEVQKDVLHQGQSSESIITDICNSVDPLHDHDSSDTSLKLGLVYTLRSICNCLTAINWPKF